MNRRQYANSYIRSKTDILCMFAQDLESAVYYHWNHRDITIYSQAESAVTKVLYLTVFGSCTFWKQKYRRALVQPVFTSIHHLFDAFEIAPLYFHVLIEIHVLAYERHIEDGFFRDEFEWFVESVKYQDIPVRLVVGYQNIGLVRINQLSAFEAAWPARIRIKIEHAPEAGEQMGHSPIFIEEKCEETDDCDNRAEEDAGTEEIDCP